MGDGAAQDGGDVDTTDMQQALAQGYLFGHQGESTFSEPSGVHDDPGAAAAWGMEAAETGSTGAPMSAEANDVGSQDVRVMGHWSGSTTDAVVGADLARAEELVQHALQTGDHSASDIPILREVVRLNDHAVDLADVHHESQGPEQQITQHDLENAHPTEIREDVFPAEDLSTDSHYTFQALAEGAERSRAGIVAALWGLLRGFAGTREDRQEEGDTH